MYMNSFSQSAKSAQSAQSAQSVQSVQSVQSDQFVDLETIHLDNNDVDISANIVFNEQRKLLSDLLEYSSSKLLFPPSLVKSLKNIGGLDTLSYFMSKYNGCVEKARRLFLKLSSMSSWGIFIDSHYLWKVSTNSIMIGIETLSKEILTYILNSSENFITRSLILHANITKQKIATFLNICKKSSNHTYIHVVKNSNGQIEHKQLSRDEIEKLLPKCIDPSKITINKSIYESYEDPHKLDLSDIFV